jgi:hypothetical protein
MSNVKFCKEPVKFGPAMSVLLLPLLFLVGALSLPYMMIANSIVARRERRFTDSLKLRGRTMDWPDFIRRLDGDNGMLIVERFSFEGPIRMWWTTDNLYETCPYPLVDWFTMLRNATFDPVRDWCHINYTSSTGHALLIVGNKDQRRTILGNMPLTVRDGVQYVEVPPPRR